MAVMREGNVGISAADRSFIAIEKAAAVLITDCGFR
jgi:hypothetical protein